MPRTSTIVGMAFGVAVLFGSGLYLLMNDRDISALLIGGGIFGSFLLLDVILH